MSQPTLRLTQTSEGDGRYRVEVALEGDGLPRQIARSSFAFALSAEEQADLRWYLETYLQFPIEPAPTIAARIERRMEEIGTELFRAVFQSSDDARDLWATLRGHLNETRVEIVSGVREAAAIPWELLRDPATGVPLALRAQAFVRAQPAAAQRPQLPAATDGPIRILLVICRPGRGDDVPFRSVASRLIKGLSGEAREAFQLDVLRPATFEQLSRALRAARAVGAPYHVVHFDGHGVYAEGGAAGGRFSPSIYSDTRPGRHGYLAFENPALEDNLELVHGPALGALLVEAGVPVLVLNACRSAHTDERPTTNDQRRTTDDGQGDEETGRQGDEEAEQSTIYNLQSAISESNGQRTTDNPHAEVRAFGSLAQEVMDAGAAGVVAMRYNVYVVTAAQFVADLYAALAQGSTLGEAVSQGRKQLAAQPLRTIAYDPIPLQDWPVPVVYEAAPIVLFPKKEIRDLRLEIAPSQSPTSNLQSQAPPPPDVGFFGRDETLLALDRAFDTQPIVLLHAYAGSGKTTTAAEFARWYAATGGIKGPVLWTSFEHHTPLARALDAVGQAFGAALEQSGVHWLTLEDPQRRDIALQVLRKVPVLWVWDNVEPVAGFPAGDESAWSAEEQRGLADFLRAARDTKAKFLLTSRRDERGWLGDLPAQVRLPPMPTQERVQLARALAEKHGRRLTEVADWRPLLWFTQGNPLAITVLVGQALRDGLATREQIQAFVDRLRTGSAAFADEESEGRSKSLGASLSYGFTHAFSEQERKVLALLHLFQGFVDVDVLRQMGHPQTDYCLPEVRGLTREAGIALLDRAAEVGLLTAHGQGHYSIHPALPWYFRGLFEQYYPHPPTPSPAAAGEGEPISPPEDQGERVSFPGAGKEQVSPLPRTGEGPGVRATRAFVEAIGALGNYYHDQYGAGNRDVIGALEAEEANLLHARQLARANGWWGSVIDTMQGLRILYDHTGRRAEWRRLVNEIASGFVDLATGGPLSGREEQWSLVTEYRVGLAREARQWDEAERLQRARVAWNRQRAAAALAAPLESLDGARRNAVRTLAASLHELGEIQRELGQPDCVQAYEESLRLLEGIGEKAGAASCAFNLGHAYNVIPALRDLAQAERWYQRSLEMYEEDQRHDRAQCLGQLGSVAYQRFLETRAAKKPEEDLLHHLNDAVRSYHQALDLLPPNAVNDLAVAHNQLGVIYRNAGDLDRALSHYRESIRYEEMQGNLYGAAQTRGNVAIALARAGRLGDALLYAQAALRNFATYGAGAADMVQKTQELIQWIEQAMRG